MFRQLFFLRLKIFENMIANIERDKNKLYKQSGINFKHYAFEAI